MLGSLAALDEGRPLRQVLFYRLCYWVLFILFILVYRARFFGVDRVPRSGGLLVVCNHQSHLDPPLVGLSLRRRNMAAVARESLFRHWPLGWLLRSWGCIPINDEEGDAGAIRASIAQLKAGRVVVIYPEGSRSPDGGMFEFKRGAWLLMSRSGVDVIPAAVEGCYDAWPRRRAVPTLIGGRVAVQFGEVIPFAELKAMGVDRALDHLAREVDVLRHDLRERLRTATCGRVPAPGPGDDAYSPRPMPETPRRGRKSQGSARA